MSSTPLTLEIPPLPAYIGTVRLFVAAVSRQLGLDEEAVDDLKVVVSEACTEAIRAREQAGEESPIRILLTPGSSTLVVEVEDALNEDLASGDSTTDNITRNLGSELIRALFPKAEVVARDGGLASVRLTLPLAQA